MFSSLAGLLLTSCADEELKPIATFEDSTIGIQAALIEGGVQEIDLANPSTASVTNTVMLRGDEAASYAIYLSFDDRDPDNGDDSKPEQLYAEFGQSDFVTVAESPYPRVTYTIAFADLIRQFNLDVDKLSAGDRFQVRTEIVSTDGRVFSAANSSAAVNGSAFSGYFSFPLIITCPLPDELFSGTYMLTYDEEGGDPTTGFGLPFPEGPVTLTPSSSTKRSFTAPWAPGLGGYNVGSMTLNIICDVAVWENKGTGLSCSGAEIILAPGPAAPIISLTDDSVITLNLIEYKGGACGFADLPKRIILTKQ